VAAHEIITGCNNLFVWCLETLLSTLVAYCGIDLKEYGGNVLIWWGKNVLLMTHLQSRKLSHTGMNNPLLIRYVILTIVNILTWGWRGSLLLTVMTHVHVHGGEHFTWWLTQHCGMLTIPVLLSYLCVTYSFFWATEFTSQGMSVIWTYCMVTNYKLSLQNFQWLTSRHGFIAVTKSIVEHWVQYYMVL